MTALPLVPRHQPCGCFPLSTRCPVPGLPLHPSPPPPPPPAVGKGDTWEEPGQAAFGGRLHVHSAVVCQELTLLKKCRGSDTHLRHRLRAGQGRRLGDFTSFILNSVSAPSFRGSTIFPFTEDLFTSLRESEACAHARVEGRAEGAPPADTGLGPRP